MVTVCFDLDGTLIRGESVTQFLAARLGHLPRALELEDLFRLGKIDNLAVATGTAAHFRGLEVASLEALLAEVPLIAGIDATVAALRRAGCRLILGTITWTFASRYFARRFGLDAYSGTAMGEHSGRLDGEVVRIFNEYDKARFVQQDCAALRVRLDQCAAIGDSRSDIPVFQLVGLAIAVNATPAAVSAAHVSLQTEDLRDVLPILLKFISSATPR
jgi:phosphoserine phosphatase